MTVTPTTLTVKAGASVEATATPAELFDGLTVSSADDTIATAVKVQNGKVSVTGVKAGLTTVNVVSKSAGTVTLNITVIA